MKEGEEPDTKAGAPTHVLRVDVARCEEHGI